MDLQYFSKRDIIAFMKGYKVYGYALPAILRRETVTELSDLPLMDCRCLVIRNIDELSYIKNIGFSGEIVIDYSMYCMNSQAVHFIRDYFPNAVITYPVELNRKQIKSLSNTINKGKQNEILSNNDQYRKQDDDLLHNNTEMIVYGYQQLMVTAQCFMENTAGCRKGNNDAFLLKDRKNRFFFTKAVCRYCYNLIYNNVPTVLFDKEEIRDYTGSIRFHFVRENETQVREILDMYFEKAEYKKEFTRGHYNRGVD